SLGRFVGFGYPEAVPVDADAAVQSAYAAARGWADTFWLYQYIIVVLGLFVLAWLSFTTHRWARWSIAGSALIFFINWFLVELDVAINSWFGTFYDMIQTALGTPGSVEAGDFYWQFFYFLRIALVYVFIGTLF